MNMSYNIGFSYFRTFRTFRQPHQGNTRLGYYYRPRPHICTSILLTNSYCVCIVLLLGQVFFQFCNSVPESISRYSVSKLDRNTVLMSPSSQVKVRVTLDRQSRVCYFVAPSLTRGRVCNLLLLLILASAVTLGSALSDERLGLSFGSLSSVSVYNESLCT
jgi:hypothetical protein